MVFCQPPAGGSCGGAGWPGGSHPWTEAGTFLKPRHTTVFQKNLFLVPTDSRVAKGLCSFLRQKWEPRLVHSLPTKKQNGERAENFGGQQRGSGALRKTKTCVRPTIKIWPDTRWPPVDVNAMPGVCKNNVAPRRTPICEADRRRSTLSIPSPARPFQCCTKERRAGRP